jgi:dephospho-CoA kinase
VKALEQYNAVLAVATPADKQMARLMEKAWHLEEVHRKQREKEAPLAAQRRRWLGIF